MPDSIQIVDVFHAKQHLFDVARALWGKGSDLAAHWGRTRRGTSSVSGTFARAWIIPGSGNQGLYVSTGVVEGACKSPIGDRLKRGGMHWSVSGADSIIALRCVVPSNRFDDF